MRFQFHGFTLLGMSILCAGCAVRGTQYPADWPTLANEHQGRCPLIQGRYLNNGASAAQCPVEGRRWTYAWDCDTTLTSNILTGLPHEGYGSHWVEIKQPDENTIVVTMAEGTTPVTLKQGSGDFSCDSNGVTISRSGSSFSQAGVSEVGNVLVTTVNGLVGSGGVDTLSRRFERARDGSLVMKVTTSSYTSYVFIPTYVSWSQYVHWRGLPADDEGKLSSHNN